MTRQTDYTNAAQQRLIRLVLLMFGDIVNGYTPGALARDIGCSATVMTRDLDNLRTAGIAEFDETDGRWRLTPRLPQQAVKVYAALGRAETRLAETKAAIHRNNDY
ncbi:IclR family transcriptional regulator [Thauera butanivorans]|uniref:IclR family transcriptional regulator n=1 Tax=Thauera butanivorans TaxID=86174 RepID=UPI003AB5F021